MADHGRFALILDNEEAALGQAAVRMIELGIDALYANDRDEAALLASQESMRLGAVVVPSGVALDSVEALLSRVCCRMQAGAQGLVVVGKPAGDVIPSLRSGR